MISYGLALFGELCHRNPRQSIVVAALAIAMAGVVILAMHSGQDQRRAENEAWWKAKLECRKAGGSYEYFGSQGYACVDVPRVK